MTARKLSEIGPPPPPLHSLLVPHDNRYGPWDERGCPPNCPYRQWAEKYRSAPED